MLSPGEVTRIFGNIGRIRNVITITSVPRC